MTGRAYLDHASTSPLRPAAARAMTGWLSSADPGRVHAEGRAARYALEDAREQVAALFGVRSRQVIFTSGATEAVNSAVYGALASASDRRVVAAAVEHSAVREAAGRWGQPVDVPVDAEGTVDVSAIEDVCASGAVGLVNCQLANHEVGTIQPVAEVAAICRRHGVMLHVDAAAGAGQIPLDAGELGADLVSVSAHKMGGPRGMGALIVSRGLRVEPLLLGGAQERARRAGLENVAAAVGFGAAAAEIAEHGPAEAARSASLAGWLRDQLLGVEGVIAYGPSAPERRLPHLVCVGVAGVEAEPVLIGLDSGGVAAHSGSSCSSETLEPSPVLAAMGVDAEHSLRFSLGWSSTEEDVKAAASAFATVVERLRSLLA